MAKRKITVPDHPLKRARGDQTAEDLTSAKSVRQQAEPYRIITAKFPIAALTASWSVGSNRPINSQHVHRLCQIFMEQGLQREAEENRLLIACSRDEVQRMIDHLGEGGDRMGTPPPWPFFKDWEAVNGRGAEIMVGQHRVEAVKAFLRKLEEDPNEGSHWWICDIYDKDTLPPRIRTRLRANRVGHTLPDNHGQIWMELATLAEQDKTLFQGSSTGVKKEMLETLGLSGCVGFPIRRLVTLWKNNSWRDMITRWCRTGVGRSTFNISLWDNMARFRIDDFWFDPFDEVLKTISKLSGGLDKAVHLSDWAALVRLPRPCSSSNMHDLFYPNAPTDVLANLSDQGHLYRRSGFLVGLEHGHYHNAARYVLGNAGQEYIDIQALLRTGRREGKILSEVISHVTRWINCEPTKVIGRENNKPQLWQNFIPALTIEHNSQAPRKSRKLQRDLFATVEGRLDQLEGSLGGDIGDDTYLERFKSPTWRDILITVRDAAGGQLQENLATLRLPGPKSTLYEQEPALIKALSFAVGGLPWVRDNPALRANGCIEELMRHISPIVIEWAAQNSQKGLTAQTTGKVPRWPLSIKELVEKQLQALTRMSVSPTAAMESEENPSVRTPPGISLAAGVKMFKHSSAVGWACRRREGAQRGTNRWHERVSNNQIRLVGSPPPLGTCKDSGSAASPEHSR
ncbi:hypothetical protein VE01_07344 [Pseudogymnoascus verrucosus]|uniref:Uncharacterized protein n=1 Tax=Pseudogymnoascus verrucosus TaxID=342668 RepID=A0A1B8GGZ8_9PEZI|nr:uncharacterized protein VE01_07344 [Pseudogymnoascus verrucosus]OBT95119.1 hypothetical protein VE01_07344 [Pseudogymnoascus verrucosus]